MQATYNKIVTCTFVIVMILSLLFGKTLITKASITVDETGTTITVSDEITGNNIETTWSKAAIDILEQEKHIAIQLEQEQFTQQRLKIIDSKRASFVDNKVINASDIVVVEPTYDENNKQVIDRRSESLCIDIRSKSNWTYEDFEGILNDEMKDLIGVALRLEEEVGINAIYSIAVGANETAWGKSMAGSYNYFNWTNDGINHFDFNTIDEFADFSIKTYSTRYINETFYEQKLGFEPEHITLEVVNVKYALKPNSTTNWHWSNVVAEIMSNLSDRRIKNLTN